MAKDKQPLKLMPLDEFKKWVAAIAKVPKNAVSSPTPKDAGKKP